MQQPDQRPGGSRRKKQEACQELQEAQQGQSLKCAVGGEKRERKLEVRNGESNHKGLSIHVEELRFQLEDLEQSLKDF